MTDLTRRGFVISASALVLAGCQPAVAERPNPGSEAEVMRLAQLMSSLGPYVSDAEAYRAARVSFSETYRLAQEYEIEDPPLTHNSKVNLGIKPRGLCYHWADDLERRLKQERFQTLQLHRAVANWDNIRLEHSTVIVSERGQSMQDGIVLDPWRKGGVLWWGLVRNDDRYRWTPRAEVFRIRREQKAQRGGA